jgi:hypothetical protein
MLVSALFRYIDLSEHSVDPNVIINCNDNISDSFISILFSTVVISFPLWLFCDMYLVPTGRMHTLYMNGIHPTIVMLQ